MELASNNTLSKYRSIFIGRLALIDLSSQCQPIFLIGLALLLPPSQSTHLYAKTSLELDAVISLSKYRPDSFSQLAAIQLFPYDMAAPSSILRLAQIFAPSGEPG
jgi:hypothetical protein